MEGKWDAFHAKPEYRTKYPSEHVVRFLFTQFPRDPAERAKLKFLDAGCGAGRHTVLLAAEGFQTYYSDVSEEAIRITSEKLKKENLRAMGAKAGMEKLPYQDNFFDGIVSFGVLYYNDMEGLKKSVAELYRILKNGAKAFVLTTTPDDYRCGKGKKIDQNTYLIEISETNEKGMLLHFLDKDQIKNAFSKFKSIGIGKSEVTNIGSERKDSHWVVILEK